MNKSIFDWLCVTEFLGNITLFEERIFNDPAKQEKIITKKNNIHSLSRGIDQSQTKSSGVLNCGVVTQAYHYIHYSHDLRF